MDRHRDNDLDGGGGVEHRKERIVHCSDAEAAVAKHFEESLRRAKLLSYTNATSYQITPHRDGPIINKSLAPPIQTAVSHKSPVEIPANAQSRQFYNYASYNASIGNDIKVLPVPPKLVTSEPIISPQQPSVIVNVGKQMIQESYRVSQAPRMPIAHHNNQYFQAPSQSQAMYTMNKIPALQTKIIQHQPHLQRPPPSRKVVIPVSTIYTQPAVVANSAVHNATPSSTLVQNKPKISSPAPAHIYGEPSRSSTLAPDQSIRYINKLPVKAPVKNVHQAYNYPNATKLKITAPPPAHNSRPTYEPPIFYSTKVTPPPPLTSAPAVTITPSNQTQPLNLGIKREDRSYVGPPPDAKKIRFGSPKPSQASYSSIMSSSPTPLALTKIHREIMEGCITIRPSDIVPTVTIKQSTGLPIPPTLVRQTPLPASPNHIQFQPEAIPKLADLSPPTQNNFLGVLARFAEAERVGNSDSLPRNLKKAWLQRHAGGDENYSVSTDSNSSKNLSENSPASKDVSKPVPVKTKPASKKRPKTVYQEDSSDEDSCTDTDTISEESPDDESSHDSDHKSGSNSRDAIKELLKRQPRKASTRRIPHVTVRRSKAEKEEIIRLKKSGESFLQNGPCFEAAPKISKCRECRSMSYRQNKKVSNIFCRFYAFRRLRYLNGEVTMAGFSDPTTDPTSEDINLWMPDPENPTKDLDIRTSLLLLNQVGDQFCDLWQQEVNAVSEHMAVDKTIAWKKVVQGVREMCDVCATTIFNYHWTCERCGFAVCIDCYKDRKRGTKKIWGKVRKNRDEYSWLTCSKKIPHEQDQLMLTQIIAGKVLQIMGQRIHEVRHIWQIPMMCGCDLSRSMESSNTQSSYIDIARMLVIEEYRQCGMKDSVEQMQIKDRTMKALESNSEQASETPAFRKDIARYRARKAMEAELMEKETGAERSSGDQFLDNLVLPHQIVDIDTAPRVMTALLSQELYPKACYGWLCDGRLLRLPDPKHLENLLIFQEQWKRALPIIVSDVTKCLNTDLWQPESFCRDFGNQRNDLVNCMNGNLVPNRPMRDFWEGFQTISKRLVDSKGVPMLLKLKDWPPGEDFAETLPERYNDLMKALPLPEYTHRTGCLNLASRLPEAFVRPDLGPKMYNAYGSALYPDKGTTNLHLDISDAVNVMVYVGIPEDGNQEDYIREAYRAIDEADCDILMRRRVREKHELPGAIWHIYSPRDSNNIRDLLNRVALENGQKITPGSDPIHDQNHYLDKKLRERLYREYGVQGYPIAQCLGDAIFIPAGAPHQVRNLHNCIKVAEDFVSPENIKQCFNLTHEFRQLSDSHSNHEDKLQIKNIIYHTLKDANAVLTSALNRRISSSGTNNVLPKVSIQEVTTTEIKQEIKEEPSQAVTSEPPMTSDASVLSEAVK